MGSRLLILVLLAMTIERALTLTALSVPIGAIGTFIGTAIYILASRDPLPLERVLRYSELGGLVAGSSSLAFFCVFAAMT